MVVEIKKNISDDKILMAQIKEEFEHISDFLGHVANNSLLQSKYKDSIIQCVEMKDVLLALDNYLDTLAVVYFPRYRNKEEYWIGHMLHQQINFIRAVVEQYSNDVLRDRNFKVVKKIASLLTYLRIVVDITACISGIEYFVPLEHRTKTMAIITKSYLMYNVLNATWL